VSRRPESNVAAATRQSFNGLGGSIWTFLHANRIAWKLYGFGCWGADLEWGERRVVDALRSWARERVLLDCPVGIGRLFRTYAGELQPRRVIAVDIAEAMLDRARLAAERARLPNLELLRADVTSLPLPDECVDQVVSEGGFHHFPDRDTALAELLRVLRPGGTIAGYSLVTGQHWRGNLAFPLFHRRSLMGAPLASDDLVATFRRAGVEGWREWRTGSLLVFACAKPAAEARA
jgi:SAM-dependent methyltransferase